METSAQRLKNFLLEVSNKHPDQNVLVVSHGALMRMFLISMKFVKNEEELPSWAIENGGFVKIKEYEGDFIVKETSGVDKIISKITT